MKKEAMKPMPRLQDNVVKEFDAIGKYRVRLLATDNGTQVLDIREYVKNEDFEGFTRRGVRMIVSQDTMLLGGILNQLHTPATPAKRKGGKK